jgi:uncharacterized protein (TIGR02453 family)
LYPGYYLHLSPGEGSFLAGGVWFFPPQELKAVRQEIDYNYAELQAIIHHPAFIKYFGKLSEAEKLSRPPKGYDNDNPALELLKQKHWTATFPLSDQDLTHERLYEQILSAMQAIKPLNDFFTRPLDDMKH